MNKLYNLVKQPKLLIHMNKNNMKLLRGKLKKSKFKIWIHLLNLLLRKTTTTVTIATLQQNIKNIILFMSIVKVFQ